MPKKASPEVVRLRKAEALIYSQPERWREGVEAIDEMVANYLRQKPAKSDWKAGALAALAARTRLANGDQTGASNSIALGLQADPKEPQLLFLQRLLEREMSAKKSN